MQRCQFAGHVIGRALCLFCDPALPAFEGRGPIKTSLLDDLPRLDRGKATEDDLRRRRSVVWLAVAASPVDGHIIAQTAEAVGKSAALQKSPYGAFLKIFSTQARTLRAHSMKQSLWDCFYSARVIK